MNSGPACHLSGRALFKVHLVAGEGFEPPWLSLWDSAGTISSPSRDVKKVLNHPYAIIGTPLSFNSWRINIPTYIPKIRWNIVTIQGRSVLLHSVHIYSPNQIRHRYFRYSVQCYPQDIFTLPHSYVAVSLGRRVCIVELSSVSTTCGLQHDHLRSLTP